MDPVLLSYLDPLFINLSAPLFINLSAPHPTQSCHQSCHQVSTATLTVLHIHQ